MLRGTLMLVPDTRGTTPEAVTRVLLWVMAIATNVAKMQDALNLNLSMVTAPGIRPFGATDIRENLCYRRSGREYDIKFFDQIDWSIRAICCYGGCRYMTWGVDLYFPLMLSTSYQLDVRKHAVLNPGYVSSDSTRARAPAIDQYVSRLLALDLYRTPTPVVNRFLGELVLRAVAWARAYVALDFDAAIRNGFQYWVRRYVLQENIATDKLIYVSGADLNAVWDGAKEMNRDLALAAATSLGVTVLSIATLNVAGIIAGLTGVISSILATGPKIPRGLTAIPELFVRSPEACQPFMANLPTAEAVRRVVVNGVQLATAAGIDTGITISERGVEIKTDEEREQEKRAGLTKTLLWGTGITAAVLLGPKIISMIRR